MLQLLTRARDDETLDKDLFKLGLPSQLSSDFSVKITSGLVWTAELSDPAPGIQPILLSVVSVEPQAVAIIIIAAPVSVQHVVVLLQAMQITEKQLAKRVCIRRPACNSKLLYLAYVSILKSPG